MISSNVFILANLVLWIAILLVIAIEERRGRHRYRNRHGVPYRRVSTADVLKMIRKAARAARQP